jgi:hypothetical protein
MPLTPAPLVSNNLQAENPVNEPTADPTTDTYFSLQKLVLKLRPDPTTPVRNKS